MYLKRYTAAPSGITKTYNRFTKFGTSINVTWSTNGIADNYIIGVTPPVMPRQMSHFTTTNTSLQLMLLYNVNYSINITAHYHNCNNWTVVSAIIGKNVLGILTIKSSLSN